MWRNVSVHARGQSEALADAVRRIEMDERLRDMAQEKMDGAAKQEPLLAQSFGAPQTPPYHCEGPFLDAHVRLVLQVLYALCEEELHLIDVEELRRMRGYEGELDELEETVKENVGMFEAFALCHDVGKWACVTFSAQEGSRGEALGFAGRPSDHWREGNAVDRAHVRDRYVELYRAFASQHASESSSAIQQLFFQAYGIRAHYSGHERIIHTPVYRSFLKRVGTAHRLPDRDVELLEDVIAYHLAPARDFVQVRPAGVERYVRLAESRGWDADDFIDLLQGGVFLDVVCSSRVRTQRGFAHDLWPLTHFLQSEHDYAPARLAQKERQRVEEEGRRRNQLLREAGLDGLALLELLEMEPGAAFGRKLKAIHAGVLARSPLPSFGEQADGELARRRAAFDERWFR